MDAEEASLDDARTIGRRLRRIRKARDKSLTVIAGLSGMSIATLSRIENGLRALDRHSEIVALAAALEIAPSELMKLPVPAPGNGGTDATIEAVRRALMGASHGLPGGEVLPLEVLRARVNATIDALCRCERERDVGAALPGLIRDLHATLAAGRDVAELLFLTAWLHTQATVPWLSITDAPVDLRSLALLLAQHAAGDCGTAVSAGLVGAASARVGLAAGAFDLATAALDAVTVPTNTRETMQLSGFLALRRSVVAAADGRPSELSGSLEYAIDLAERTGEGNAYGLGFGPINVGLYRMAGLLEIGDHERAATIAESLNPQAHVNQSRRAAYWADYGRALARIPGRQQDAVMALRRAELISPYRIQRGPVVREVLDELRSRVPRDSPAGRELRAMAYRAGLPV
ncbi:MAG TPA: helix-turn-helix transcriptional regulator [Pseudonocardiaceae bacterium]|nr:helix-turn-helix transcriptional regulator [Pseudonocardiaceae bacterium]